jgi:hypothetical protein
MPLLVVFNSWLTGGLVLRQTCTVNNDYLLLVFWNSHRYLGFIGHGMLVYLYRNKTNINLNNNKIHFLILQYEEYRSHVAKIG